MYSFNMFGAPPSTRYDVRFTIARISVRIHPLFWVIALFLGSSSGDLFYVLMWVVVVLVSILAHELGHALAFRWYGLPSQIVLHLMGGVTVPQSVPWGSGWVQVALTPLQEMVISLAGPVAGFLMAAITVLVSLAAGGTLVITRLFGVIPWVSVFMPGGGFANVVIASMLWVNIFWGLINLVPVQPLDGGTVARHVLTAVDPAHGATRALQLSVVAGTLVALAGLLVFRSLYMALLFGLLAYQSYQAMRGRAGGLF